MLVFSNPLGAEQFDRVPILVHPKENLGQDEHRLRLVYRLYRSVGPGNRRVFYCYRYRQDVRTDAEVENLVDPFPVPQRGAQTGPRARFKLPFEVGLTH